MNFSTMDLLITAKQLSSAIMKNVYVNNCVLLVSNFSVCPDITFVAWPPNKMFVMKEAVKFYGNNLLKMCKQK